MAAEHYVELDWETNLAPVDGYNVYRGIGASPVSPTPINVSLVTSSIYTDRTVYAGLQYHYQVKAVLGAGESDFSADIVVPFIPYDDVPVVYSLGAANGFGILAATTITAATSGTIIRAGLGLYPGTSVTGFPPALVLGSYHVADATAQLAIANATTLKTQYSALPGAITVGADLGNTTLEPGLYKVATSTGLGEGTLVLDGGGNSAAVWVFQIGTTLITAASTSIILTGGAQAANVFWMVGTSATLGASSNFVGNIVAGVAISVAAGVKVEGRLVALTGAITFAGAATVQCYERTPCVLTIPAALDPLPPAPRPSAPINIVPRILV